jgi:predicted dinucleotide-binding enzyme
MPPAGGVMVFDGPTRLRITGRKIAVRIGIIGSGHIGGTLGAALARAGHQVKFGSRHPQKDTEVIEGTEVTDLGGALADAEVVLLALPGGAVDGFLAEHAGSLDGKLVIDATNQMGTAVTNAAAQVGRAAPTARYARAFNTFGWENLAEPLFEGVPADQFFSCRQEDRAVVEELITAAGLHPAYLGEDRQDVVDGVLPLWFALVQANGGRRHVALRVLRR